MYNDTRMPFQDERVPLTWLEVHPDDAKKEGLEVALAHTTSLHHRLCPRQVLGVRMGLFAGQLLDLDLPRADKRLFIFIEMDGCLADGLSAATGCWFGRRTLRLVDFGKVAATFVDTETQRAVRISPRAEARDLAISYASAAPSRWHAQRDGYKVMPSQKLLKASLVELTAPLAAIISQPGARVVSRRVTKKS
jgi:formylmethanofuran dehydrogenase subunit E